MARRGGARFSPSQVTPCRCPLLGWNPNDISVEGRTIGTWFFKVNTQPEVGDEAYDKGAKILHNFFKQEIEQFLTDDLMPLGRQIIETCMNEGTLDDYASLIPHESISDD
jgi:hypothetical protein